MNLRDLRYLVALAELRHFGRAADACHVSQPTLSAAIRKLEEHLGLSLFERRPREVRVTADAEPVIAQQGLDRVVVQLGNIPEFIAVVCALFRAQLVPVYALPAHRLTEVAHFARKSEASAYVCAERYETFDYRTLARELQTEVPAVRQVFVVGDAAGGIQRTLR